MSRHKKEALHPLTEEERTKLAHLVRSSAQAAATVARAKSLLAVGDGKEYTQAAKAAGRKSGDAVSRLVARFNREQSGKENDIGLVGILETVTVKSEGSVLGANGYSIAPVFGQESFFLCSDDSLLGFCEEFVFDLGQGVVLEGFDGFVFSTKSSF